MFHNQRQSNRGRRFCNVLVSDLTSKSTCRNPDISIDIACHKCRPKLDILTHLQANKTTTVSKTKVDTK